MKEGLKTCCRGIPFYRCEFEKACSYGDKPDNCALDYSFFIKDIGILKDDCHNEGYTAQGIESNLDNLNNVDMDVEGDSCSVSSWLKSKSLMDFSPSCIDVKLGSQYQIRSSELGGECMIAGLISKTKREFKKMYDENNLSKAGTALHSLCNSQHVDDYAHNRTWELLGHEPVPRGKYCEKPLEFTVDGITVRGSADSLIDLGDCGIIFDFKRSLFTAYESRSKKLQLMSYLMGRENHSERFPVNYLITTKRSLPKKNLAQKRFMRYNITLVTDDLRKMLIEEIHERFRFQNNAVQSVDYYISEVLRRRDSGFCTNKRLGGACFSKEMCDDIFSAIKGKRSDDPKKRFLNEHRGLTISDLLNESVILNKKN